MSVSDISAKLERDLTTKMRELYYLIELVAALQLQWRCPWLSRHKHIVIIFKHVAAAATCARVRRRVVMSSLWQIHFRSHCAIACSTANKTNLKLTQRENDHSSYNERRFHQASLVLWRGYDFASIQFLNLLYLTSNSKKFPKMRNVHVAGI